MPFTPEEIRARKAACTRRYYRENREKVLAKAKRYRQENRDELNARNKLWRQNNHAKELARYRRRRLEDPAREYRRTIKARELKAGRPRPDRCEVCGGTQGGVVFDHCHQRGIFRGWLCNGCNTILGYAHDDPNRLRMLIVYLKRTENVVSPQLALPGV